MKHINNFTLTSLLILSGLSVTNAQDFDPKSCSSIVDVTVPNKIESNDNQFVFISNDNTIEVSANNYLVNGLTINLNDVSGYYDAVGDFFTKSSEFAQLFGEGNLNIEKMQIMKLLQRQNSSVKNQEIMENFTQMCRVILNIASLNNFAFLGDSNFVAGVQVELSND